mmetsp:Transcript_10429/g.21437  ORF Transcript_10429/g.21437 Transcript_10429/m.21437 type:complete len:200 (-) Transcript_10429:2127-2726(-)
MAISVGSLLFLLVLLSLSDNVVGFSIGRASLSSTATTQRRWFSVEILNMSVESSEQDELDYLTPSQVKILRKEADKRYARKSMPRIQFSEDDQDECLSKIGAALCTSELVMVSGLSKGNKKGVKEEAEFVEYEVMRLIEKEVFVLTIKGSSATFYSPFSEEEKKESETNSIQLFNSYRPNQWSKRIKAPRDSRGQIIKD